MAEESTGPVRVGAQERNHPALRRLARACIALARHQLQLLASTPSLPPTTVEPPASGPDPETQS